MIEYRKSSLALQSPEALSAEWGEWHANDDRIQRHLFDDEGFLLATETLEGDAADVMAFAVSGNGVTTHSAEAARMISWRQERQTHLLLSSMPPG